MTTEQVSKLLDDAKANYDKLSDDDLRDELSILTQLVCLVRSIIAGRSNK
jgi:hypothetical protein